jgi:hypothetical protein
MDEDAESGRVGACVVQWIDYATGTSYACGEITDENQSGTSAGSVTYSAYSDCADCNTSEGP